MRYPHVLDEAATLELVLAGRSIARYGDGELRVALDRSCVSQEAHPALAHELREILRDGRGCLVGVPNVYGTDGRFITPKQESWLRFTRDGFLRMFGPQKYVSSFITRPDSAPWIDTDDYWRRVRDIWRGKDVTLVLGDRRSLRPEEVEREAASMRVIESTTKHAYREIDRLQEEIGSPAGPVVMCLGCTATALAARLDRRGVHGIDLGHIGMFMRHAGIYRISIDELASIKYRHELQTLHSLEAWGTRGARHVEAVRALMDRVHQAKGGPLDKVTVLDYGAGRCSLRDALAPHRVQCYDPGIRGLDVLPKPSDVVVCIDVMEHVEPKKLDNVISHLQRLTSHVALVIVATREARTVLPLSGRNAHLTVESAEWWTARFARPGWTVESSVNRKGKEVHLTIARDR
jgi:hypothetical protein